MCNSLALTQNIPCGLNNHISRAKIGMIAKKRSQDVPSWNSPLLPALCRARRGRKYRTQEILPWVKYDDPRLSVANWERLSISPNKYIYPFRRTTPNGFRIFLINPPKALRTRSEGYILFFANNISCLNCRQYDAPTYARRALILG